MSSVSHRTVVKSPNLPPPSGPYSPGIKAGGFVFVSGQVAVDPRTGQVVGKTVEEQTERVLENVKTIIESAGASLKDVVKVSVYLADIGNFDKMNSVYRKYFPEEPPTRTTVQAGMARKEFLVEIDAIAYKP